jgi:hypothetical protein
MALPRALVPVRSLVASLIARGAPKYYKQIIERRHPGVLVIGDPGSDVRVLKDEALEHVVRSLEAVQLRILAKIDDRNCWIVLASSGDRMDDPECVVAKLLERGLRISIARESGRTKRITSQERLEKLKKKNPLRITAIRAGVIWMRGRGYRQVGWHASARIHFYDWDEEKKVYRARNAGNLPPMISRPSDGKTMITGLSKVETRLDKVRFPIDVVYTWVDGNDRAWNEKRLARAAEQGINLHRVANSQARYINRDELCYSLRSLYYYAPWIRNIYLVTDDQVPAWYDSTETSVLKIVSHRELFPKINCLPTFNSHAIESVLHRIPGLSEQFIYMNDDVFFSSVVQPESFFEVNGIARTFLSRSMIPFCSENHSDIASEWGAINANDLLYQASGTIMPYKTKHTPIPLRKSLLERLESRFPEHFERLRSTPFRTKKDVAPTSSLHSYFGMAEGFVVRGDIAYRYINLARPDLRRALHGVAYSRQAMVYCLNDTEVENPDEFDWDYQEELVTGFLNMMYPYRAPWEKTEADTETLQVDEQ